jgi:hypothetical protein
VPRSMEQQNVSAPRSFKGGHFRGGRFEFQFQFHFSASHKSAWPLGTFQPEQAASGARLYDAAQILVRGPCADINFEWSSYTQADIQRAVEVLQAKGLDVHQAVVAGEEKPGSEWFGVREHRASWQAHLSRFPGQQRNTTKAVTWQGLPSAEAAARQADCGCLAVRGLGCTVTNFPASAYSQLQLQQAGEHAVRKGVDVARVKENLEAVEKVWAPLIARVQPLSSSNLCQWAASCGHGTCCIVIKEQHADASWNPSHGKSAVNKATLFGSEVPVAAVCAFIAYALQCSSVLRCQMHGSARYAYSTSSNTSCLIT